MNSCNNGLKTEMISRLDEGSLLNEGDLEKHNIKAIWGNKVGSTWLTVNGDSILVKRKTTMEGKVWWWDCRYRRNSRCPFTMKTSIIEDTDEETRSNQVKSTQEDPLPPKILEMTDPEEHTCSQNWLDVKEQEFRNQIKKAMKTEFKTPCKVGRTAKRAIKT